MINVTSNLFQTFIKVQIKVKSKTDEIDQMSLKSSSSDIDSELNNSL